MNISDAIKYASDKLFSVPDRDVDVMWILSAVTGLSRCELRFEKDRVLTEKQENLLNAILSRRAEREPLQYIFGFVPFYNVELKCDRRALIPRDETACMAEEAVRIIKEKNYSSVLDLCTGSGAIAVAVKHNLPSIQVCASDISEDALSLAKENAQKNSVCIEFKQGDLFEPWENRKFGMIISNPPYVATKDMEKLERELFFEPACALDGGCDGLDFYRDIVLDAKEHLVCGGMLMFEIGFDQGDALRFLLAKQGFGEIKVEKDYSGLDRVVSCILEE